MFILKN